MFLPADVLCGKAACCSRWAEHANRHSPWAAHAMTLECFAVGAQVDVQDPIGDPMCHPITSLQSSLGLQQDPNNFSIQVVNGAPRALCSGALRCCTKAKATVMSLTVQAQPSPVSVPEKTDQARRCSSLSLSLEGGECTNNGKNTTFIMMWWADGSPEQDSPKVVIC